MSWKAISAKLHCRATSLRKRSRVRLSIPRVSFSLRPEFEFEPAVRVGMHGSQHRLKLRLRLAWLHTFHVSHEGSDGLRQGGEQALRLRGGITLRFERIAARL